MGVAQNIHLIKEKIAAAAERSGRSVDDVSLIAVTKHISTEIVKEAVLAGVRDLGENRVQEGTAKIGALAEHDLRWHLIGTLQTNKVRQAIPAFAIVHSLDRWHLAEALQMRCEELNTTLPVMIEVNVAGEASKHGLDPSELSEFLSDLCNLSRLRPWGLMTMAPFVENPEEVRSVFRGLRLLRDHVAGTIQLGAEFKHLSMGMSNDYEVAVEEGATYVRIGTAIFS